MTDTDLLPFADQTFADDPYPHYAVVRERTPVYASPSYGVHVVTRHADVFRLLRDRRLSARQLDFGIAEVFHDSILGQDSPDHTRLRKISSSWFTPARVREWSAVTQSHVDACLDRAAAEGGLDVVDGLSFPSTYATMAHILGVGTDDARLARQAVLDIGRALRPAATESDVTQARTAFDWFLDHVAELVAHKRRHPGTGMLDDFLAAHDGGRMSMAEVSATVTLFYAVGHLDNSFLIHNGITLLLQRPELAARFVADSTARPVLIAEILRYDTPEQFVTRYVTEDIDVDGDTLPGDSVVMLMIGSANRDDAVFPEPDEMRGDRDNVIGLHLAFGGGQHGCAGQVLARAQADIAISGLLSRFPSAQLGEVTTAHTEFLRRLTHVPVTW